MRPPLFEMVYSVAEVVFGALDTLSALEALARISAAERLWFEPVSACIGPRGSMHNSNAAAKAKGAEAMALTRFLR